MAKFLTSIDLAKNELQNAAVQNLASDPSSPVAGQIYFNTTDSRLKQYTGSVWVEYSTASSAGDASTNTATSVDSEVAVFSGTTGKLLKRATGSGIAKLTSGVLSTATSGTDYAPATSGSSILKGNGSGGFSSAVSGTDFAPATSGTSALKGNGSGGTTSATLNDVGAPTSAFSMNSQRLTTMADPSSAQDAATKNYVDLAVQGIAWKSAVRAATTANGTLASAYANGSVVDGVTLATGDRILLKNQTTGTENGIYTVNASGAPTRVTDADTGAEMAQAAVFVREGTANAESAWVCSNDGTITLGTTALTFVQFSTAGGVQSATTSTAGISRYATTTETNAKSVSTAAVTPAGLASYARTYTQTIGDGSTTSIAVTHSLSNQYVVAQVYDVTSNAKVDCDIVLTSSSVTTFTFAVAPTTNQYRVVIAG